MKNMSENAWRTKKPRRAIARLVDQKLQDVISLKWLLGCFACSVCAIYFKFRIILHLHKTKTKKCRFRAKRAFSLCLCIRCLLIVCVFKQIATQHASSVINKSWINCKTKWPNLRRNSMRWRRKTQIVIRHGIDSIEMTFVANQTKTVCHLSWRPAFDCVINTRVCAFTGHFIIKINYDMTSERTIVVILASPQRIANVQLDTENDLLHHRCVDVVVLYFQNVLQIAYKLLLKNFHCSKRQDIFRCWSSVRRQTNWSHAQLFSSSSSIVWSQILCYRYLFVKLDFLDSDETSNDRFCFFEFGNISIDRQNGQLSIGFERWSPTVSGEFMTFICARHLRPNVSHYFSSRQ